MKSIFILAALLLSFQVKSQTAHLGHWKISDLSAFSYQNIAAADLSLSSYEVTLHLMTERGPLSIEADILYTEKTACGATVTVASTTSNEEIVVSDFSQSACPQALNTLGQIEVQYKVFERKSLHPVVDTFYAQSFSTASAHSVTSTMLEQIESRENISVRRLDERLRIY